MDWWSIVGWILAVFLALPTIIRVIRRAGGKQPVWAHKVSRLLTVGSSMPKGIELSFNGQPISGVCRTYVLLFNRGKETINHNDIAEKPTIWIDGHILGEPKLVKVSDPSNMLSVSRTSLGENDCITFDFEYLDRNDGGVVELVHTPANEIGCKGKIKGASSKKIENMGDLVPYSSMSLVSLLKTIDISLPPVMAGFFTYVILTDKSPMSWFKIGALVVAWLAVLFIAIRAFSKPRRFPDWTAGIETGVLQNRLAIRLNKAAIHKKLLPTSTNFDESYFNP